MDIKDNFEDYWKDIESPDENIQEILTILENEFGWSNDTLPDEKKITASLINHTIKATKKFLSKPKKICKVDISEFGLDNEFTFYDDGSIHRFWDENRYRYNLSAWISADNINSRHKAKILEELKGKEKELVQEILENND